MRRAPGGIADGARIVTRQDALAIVARLAQGLRADVAGVDRLLERLAMTDTAEELRAALLVRGAEAVLDEADGAARGGELR